MGHYECKHCGQRPEHCECRPPSPAKERKVKKRRKMDTPALERVETYEDSLSDFDGPLFLLKAEVEKLIDRYGPTATVRLDAGHNNVQAIVTHAPPYYGTLLSLPDTALTGEIQMTIGMRYQIFEKRDDGTFYVATDQTQVGAWVHMNRFGQINTNPETQP